MFAETRRDADSLYNLLQNGATFESLAPSVFRDPELASSGGDLGYFSLDEMDIAFEEQAYSMQPGQISAPVKTSRGYSIIKLTEVAAAPMLTETEFARRRSSLRAGSTGAAGRAGHPGRHPPGYIGYGLERGRH